MNLKNRLKNDKKILLASVLFLISILSDIIECVIQSVYFEVYVGNLVAYIIPGILFLLHTLMFYKTERSQKLFAISYVLLLILTFPGIFQGVVLGNLPSRILIINIMFALSYGTMVYLSLRGAKNRKLSLIGIIIPFALNLISFVPFILEISQMFVAMSSTMSGLMRLISYLGSFSLSAALFIIAPDTIQCGESIEATKGNSLEKELVILKLQYDSGKITEQEYSDKKKELLNSL